MVNNFSENLKHYRIKNNMTQQELAKKLYMTRQSIPALEVEKRRCDLDTIIRITDIFNVTLNQLTR